MYCLRFSFIFIFSFFLCCCGNNSSNINTQGKDLQTQNVYYPFAPRLDIDASSGNPKNSANVLSIWQGYVAGNILNYKNLFADQVSMTFPDKKLAGSRDSILELYQKRTEGISTLQPHFNFWHPVYEAEKNEDWVLVWLNEESTLHNKQVNSQSVHQIWKFNADNKIFELQEFRSGWSW
jgi:hypothetical protein